MAQINIAEFQAATSFLPRPKAPALAYQKITLSGSAASSNAFKGDLIYVCPDADCAIDIGQNPTASNGTIYLPAKVPQFFVVSPGDKLSAINYP